MKALSKLTWIAGAVALTAATPSQAEPAAAEQIIRDKCLGCHTEENASAPQWSRMSHQRKTPEGWLMTIGRMQAMHGLQIEDAERRTLVKYFADRQGLAPEETAGYRYAMERRLNTQESFDEPLFAEMCGRCHSGARVMLQRRPASEWEHLVHFHLGQWPTTEYQAMGRDRDWLGIALNTMVPTLAKELPLETDAWRDWQQAEKPALNGSWRFFGTLPGKGELEGMMHVSGSDAEGYDLELSGRYQDGTSFKGYGEGIVYTGYEWRGSLNVSGKRMRQVLAASKDGSRLAGRMFETLHDETGLDFMAVKNAGATDQVVAVQPSHIKAGTTQRVKIVGNNLTGRVSLGAGLKVTKVLSRTPELIELEVAAAGDATTGDRVVKVGDSAGPELYVYQRVDGIKVVPAFAVARVGDNGGSTPKVEATFQAEGWTAGSDGKIGTHDDQRIGFLPANWQVAPFDAVAEADRDVEFAGQMNAANGVFTPGLAGPNPDRRMSTNNAGNLKVIAKVGEGKTAVTGEGQLIVTVQRWNNPPLP